ncbi:MAG TPA: DUF4157 domain-containing protein [Jatrophihabitans sp.]|nr:DUF4157 domain-containing protein [Jatrophihabitans sp.]
MTIQRLAKRGGATAEHAHPEQSHSEQSHSEHAHAGREQAPAGVVPVPGLIRRQAGGALRVGATTDPAEAEADATARAVVQALRGGIAAAPEQHGDCHDGCGHEGGTVRRQALVGAEGGELDAGTRGKLDRLRGGGRPLPGPVRASMEAAFGADLGGVRVHTGPAATELNHAIQAKAFTAGSDIAFAGGMPDTGTAEGQHLLAHELTHVLQNGGAGPVRRTVQEQGSDDILTWPELVSALEDEEIAVSPAPRLILRYWANSPQVRTYSSLSSLVSSANDAVPVIEPAFAASLQDLAEVGEFLASATSARRKTKAGPGLVQALQARRLQLQKEFGEQLDDDYALPAPNLDQHYRTPSALKTTVASTTGRDDGKWHQTTNTVSGSGGKKTGSVNLALLQGAQAEGSVQQVGSHLEQVCPTCAQVTHVASFEVDHQQAFSDIRNRLHLLAEVMTQDATVYASVSKGTASFHQIFAVTGVPGMPGFKVEALASGVHMYSNNLDNLMRICRLCNGGLGKSDMEMIEWYRTSPLYGQAFLDTYQLPGTSAKGVIELTKTGVGWGVAAREWFNHHHLPVFTDQFLTAQIQEATRQRLISQSNLGIAVDREQDPQQRQQLSDQHQQQSRNNQAMLGGLRGVHDYHTNPDTAPFAMGSPARHEEEHRTVDKRRDKRKRSMNLKSLPAYQVGLDDAERGTREHAADYKLNSTERDAYEEGYVEGEAANEERALEGELDALTWNLMMTDPEVWGEGFHYAMAYQGVLDRRRAAFDAGYQLFAQDSDADPDAGYARGEKYSEQLVRDYLLGYTSARQQARRERRRANLGRGSMPPPGAQDRPSAYDPSVRGRTPSPSPRFDFDEDGSPLPASATSQPFAFSPYGMGQSSAPSQPFVFGAQQGFAGPQGGFGSFGLGPQQDEEDEELVMQQDDDLAHQ